MTAAYVGFAIGIALVVGYQILLYSPPVRRARAEAQARIQCPFCQHTGAVKAGDAVRKRGISGAKATGAVMTGGVSMLATGLSRKEHVTHLHCSNCGMGWDA